LDPFNSKRGRFLKKQGPKVAEKEGSVSTQGRNACWVSVKESRKASHLSMGQRWEKRPPRPDRRERKRVLTILGKETRI